MIFSQYKETCEVILDYPKIGGENIKDFIKKAIRNIFHTNIDISKCTGFVIFIRKHLLRGSTNAHTSG